MLHDIGKMGVPDAILHKPGPLSPDERELMVQHPTLAYEMLSPVAFLGPALAIPYCHHEKWDGTGYPRGLKGEQIPLAARIFAVVDIWDALRSDRPYRDGWSPACIRQHLLALAGSHLDPDIVALFLREIDHIVGSDHPADDDFSRELAAFEFFRDHLPGTRLGLSLARVTRGSSFQPAPAAAPVTNQG
jgi:HD-GYP domain-containing protein (c-di-GMP phosphodiesterase class II)